MRRQHAAAQREGTALTLAVIDLDHFKSVNDRAGHRAGDRVLVAVATALAAGRAADRAFRVGGDEFAVLLPGADLDGTRQVLERLRADVERQTLGVTMSIGIAELGAAAPDVVGLWECTDAAVYEAKRRGGNAVMSYDEVRESGIAT